MARLRLLVKALKQVEFTMLPTLAFKLAWTRYSNLTNIITTLYSNTVAMPILIKFYGFLEKKKTVTMESMGIKVTINCFESLLK